MHSLSHSPLQIFSKPGADSNSAKDYVYSFTRSLGRIYFRIYKVIERASRPLVGFGLLIDNTIKGLTCLHEIMSKYLICGMI